MVNNAAVQVEARLLDQTVEDFRAIVDTNLLGTFLYSRAVLPSMLAQGSGVIVNLSSVLGLVGDAMLPVYSATKHGILGLTEVDRDRVRGPGDPVRGHLPGRRRHGPQPALLRGQADPVAFRADIEREYPDRRIARPSEIARTAVFLASDDAIGINGTHVLVDGGILSRLYDLYEDGS